MCRMMMSVISLKRLRLRLSEYNKKFAFELSNVSRLEQSSTRILLDEDSESSLADLRLSLLASMEIIRTEEHNTLDRRTKGQIIIDRVTD